MFSVDEKTIAELRNLRECLAAIDSTEATVLGLMFGGELSRRIPDLIRVLSRVADSTRKHGLTLGRTLTITCYRAFCVRLGDLHPGTAIEVRVPPWATVQVSFGDDPKHTRGTPLNVVEMEPSALLSLATGQFRWAEAEVKVSGSQVKRVATVFPLTAP